MFHTSLVEGQEDSPTARPQLARGEGVELERELQMELNGSIFRRESDDSTLLFRVQIIFLDKYIF